SSERPSHSDSDWSALASLSSSSLPSWAGAFLGGGATASGLNRASKCRLSISCASGTVSDPFSEDGDLRFPNTLGIVGERLEGVRSVRRRALEQQPSVGENCAAMHIKNFQHLDGGLVVIDKIDT